MTKNKNGKGFSEQPERVSESGKKGSGLVNSKLKKDPGRAVEAGYRSNQERRGAGDNT